MSNSLRRLAKIEAALEQLMQREKAIVVWSRPVETEAQAIQNAIDAGEYDPDTQDLILVISNIPTNPDWGKWTDDLPEANRGPTLAEEIQQMAVAPRFEGSYPTEPTEPEPEKRRPIHYPNSGIV
jgi:hypothetical protein